MKKVPIMVILSLILPALIGCSLWSGLTDPDGSLSPQAQNDQPDSTPEIMADTVFSGYAFIDQNGNELLDDADSPLQGAQFTLAGFSSLTDSNGYAMVLIPGEWDQPVSARMIAPEGSSYSLIGPAEETLQNGKMNRANFLFAPESEAQNPITATKTAVQVDLIYCTTDDGIELTMDMYRPQVGKAPYPVVIYVHGGGWSSGDKSDGVGLIFKQELTRRGYIFVSINYRLAPKYSFPDPIEDVKCAVRHLRDHAAEYNLDPTRVGAIGGSAGGHLVALLGTTDAEAGWDVGQYSEQSSRVQAVVDLYGPADLLKMFSGSSRSLMLKTFNASNGDDPILSTYSPVTYVSADDPPFLIMHGDKDQVVSLEQSEILYERLKQAGVPVKLVVVKNAGHSFKPVEGEIDPNFPELFKMVGDFFDQYLK